MTPLLSTTNVRKCLEWCKNHQNWSMELRKNMIFSDEFVFTLFPTTGRIYVWRQPKEALEPKYLLPSGKHREGSVMICGAILRKSAGLLVSLHGVINSNDCLTILSNPSNDFRTVPGRQCNILG